MQAHRNEIEDVLRLQKPEHLPQRILGRMGINKCQTRLEMGTRLTTTIRRNENVFEKQSSNLKRWKRGTRLATTKLRCRNENVFEKKAQL